MRFFQLRSGVALIALAALPALSGCVNVASLDCNEIAEKAKEISQNQPIKLQSVANVRELSRTDSDARCIGDATLADGGTAPIYLRAYEDGSNVMVAYQGTPFP
jgi:hypothetical protein